MEPPTVTSAPPSEQAAKQDDIQSQRRSLNFEFNQISPKDLGLEDIVSSPVVTPQHEDFISPKRPGEVQAQRSEGLNTGLRGLDFELKDLSRKPESAVLEEDYSTPSPEDYVETKLDLAMAYLDMGDPVGARSLLEEVLQEGNASQKQRAEEFMTRLG